MAINNFYTPKQLKVLKDANNKQWHFLINHGAKRSGKTVIDNDLFLMELQRVRREADKLDVDEPMFILAGYSSKSIQNNILQELSNKYGIEFHFDKHGSFNIFGVKVVQTFTGSISGLGAIRGMTAWGAYINEGSLANREVFEEIKDRCSAFDDTHIIVDTNPDNPEHWLKKDYIDNKNPEAGILEYHFELDDNAMFLPKNYIMQQKAGTAAGMFYERTILGLWVSGEGAVYSEFNKETMTVSKKEALDKNYERFFAGIDWGFNHPTVFTVFGYKDGEVTLLEEHTANKKQMSYWVEVAKSIKKRYGNIPFYGDPANSEHMYDLRHIGINAISGNKNVINGIQYVAGKMHKGLFKVVYAECPEFKKEIYRYVWNDKTGDVVKEYDHCLDSLRYAIYTDYLTHRQKAISTEDLGLLRRRL